MEHIRRRGICAPPECGLKGTGLDGDDRWPVLSTDTENQLKERRWKVI